MLTYDEFKEAMDKGFIKGDTVQIVRKNGKIHDYVLDGERVEPHETLSLEKVSDIIIELTNLLQQNLVIEDQIKSNVKLL